MDGIKRRELLTNYLIESKEPISGSELARRLGVSRQIVVQDIALLRATNKNILATTKGYLMYYPEIQTVNRCFLVRHTTEEIADELSTIVDCGGKVLDVIVMHDVYGQIEADLIIRNRQDVYDFVEKVMNKKTVPLKELTDGVHYHTVEAASEAELNRIEDELRRKKYLINE